MDNGVVVLDMKSRNNANSPHSPAVTMTTEPPEVGGKSQEMEAEGRRGEAGQEGCMRPVFFVFLNYFFFPPHCLAGPPYIPTVHNQDVQTLLCEGIPPPRGGGEAQFKRQPRGLENRKEFHIIAAPTHPLLHLSLFIY